MTSRRSSGSIRADSAVEPTNSENTTVTWRRSAASCGFRFRRSSSLRCFWRRWAKLFDGGEYFQSMPKGDAEFFQALVCQMRQD